MFSLRSPLCAVALLAACQAGGPLDTGEARRPLIGGEIDVADPAVVALTRGGSSSFCTGTLVSPSVVLTAAHCVDMAGADPDVVAFFGSDTTGEGKRIGVIAKTQHPMWTGNVGSHDVGMMLLTFPQDPTLPMPMNTSPASEQVGAAYRHVGFGVFDRDTMKADGKKRTGTTTITSFSGDVIRSGDDTVNICFGDSGGPGLLTIDGTEAVAGIHSYTSTDQCLPPSGDTAVDLYVDDFILPWIQENDPACGEDLLCSRIGCTDDPDCQPCGPDGTCTSDCPLPDPDCPTSGLGEICRLDSQCIEGSCVAWFPDTSYKFCTIECTPGGSECPAGMSCQNVDPHGNICYPDGKPTGVVGDDCEVATDCGSYICDQGSCVTRCDIPKGKLCLDGFTCADSGNGVDYFCYADDEGGGGGCATAPGSGSHGWPWAVVFALLIGMRRRRATRQRAGRG